MKSRPTKTIAVTLVLLTLFLAVAARGQDKGSDSKGKSDSTPPSIRLTIVVTGGEDKKPVDSASVYVKYVEERKLGKKNKIEMNLKTNLSGVCHVPEIPAGKFLIQVIAPGWKTYGEYFEVNQPEQTINIDACASSQVVLNCNSRKPTASHNVFPANLFFHFGFWNSKMNWAIRLPTSFIDRIASSLCKQDQTLCFTGDTMLFDPVFPQTFQHNC